MKKFINRLEDLFFRVFFFLILIIVCSLILPFVLFAASVLGELSDGIRDRLIENPYVWYGSAIVFGIFSKIWWDYYSRQRKERKEKEKDKQSTDFGWRILTDESDRKYMKEYIEDVEKGRKKTDEVYKSYKKIEEHLITSESYRIWKNRKIKDIEYDYEENRFL